jgi:hypothetical protein
MNDSSKTSLVTVAGFVALVAAVSIMANCTVRVTQTNAASCVAKGGEWTPVGAIGDGRCESKRP